MTLVLLLSLLCQTPSPSSPPGAIVIDGRSGAAIADARVLIAGYPGGERTDAAGHLRWTATPPAAPVTIVVILPDGRASRPIRVTTWDATGDTVLTVDAAVNESVTIAGVAPTIDTTPGSSTTFLPGADVRLRAPATLAQALENVPGVDAIADGGQGAVPAIRGLGRGRSLILLDGSRVSTERRAGPNASFLDPAAIDTIEVARGPASVAYGSDGFGGVIAVRTGRPDYHSPLRARVSGTFGAGIPEARGEAELSSGYGTGGILISVRARDFGEYRAATGVVPNSGWRDGDVSARWEQQTSQGVWSAGWQTGLARDIGRPRSDSTTILATTPYEDSHRLTAGYAASSAGWFRNLRVDGLFGSSRERTDQDRLATVKQPRSLSEGEMSWLESQLRVTGEHGFGRVRLEMGADYQGRYRLEATDTSIAYTLAGAIASTQVNPSIVSAHRNELGLFTQADAQVWTRVYLSAGIRGDTVHNTNAGGFFGDRRVDNGALAGVASATVALASHTTMTAQIARGFRDPTLSDRFYRGPVGRGFVEGNPDLQPETSRQIDLTGRWDNGSLHASAAYYDYRITNLVERYLVGTTNFFVRNRGAARLRGVEVDAQNAFAHGFVVELAAQVSRGEDASDGASLDDVAPDAVAVIVRHTQGRLDSYLRTAAVARHDAAGPSEVPTPGYTALDAGATWHWTRRLEVRGVLRNALDDHAYANAGPRWVYAPGRNGSLTFALVF